MHDGSSPVRSRGHRHVDTCERQGPSHPRDAGSAADGHLLLTALGVVLIGISGWLGGEMVYVGGVGVAPAARETAGPRPR